MTRFDRYLIKMCKEVYEEMGHYHRENTYQNALVIELRNMFNVIKEYPLPIEYKNQIINTYFVDIVLDYDLPIEIKSIKKLGKKEETQIWNYMKFISSDEGYLINFGHDNLEIWKYIKNKKVVLI